MEASRFAKLSELKKGDVVRSPQFVEGVPGFSDYCKATILTREKKLWQVRKESRGNTLFVVHSVTPKEHRPFIRKRTFLRVELRELNEDGSYNFERETLGAGLFYPEKKYPEVLLAFPGANDDHPDFFVEVVGEMNPNWTAITRALRTG